MRITAPNKICAPARCFVFFELVGARSTCISPERLVSTSSGLAPLAVILSVYAGVDATAKASSCPLEPRCHPSPRAQDTFQQGRNIKVGVEPRKMNPEAERFHLDRLEILAGRVLQAFDITRGESDFDARGQPNYDPISAGVVMSANSTWSSHPRLSSYLGCFEFFRGQFIHGAGSMQPPARPDGAILAATPCALRARCSLSLPEARTDEIYHHHPAGPEDMHMSGRVVVRDP